MSMLKSMAGTLGLAGAALTLGACCAPLCCGTQRPVGPCAAGVYKTLLDHALGSERGSGVIVVNRMTVRGYHEVASGPPPLVSRAYLLGGDLRHAHSLKRIKQETVLAFRDENAKSHDLSAWIPENSRVKLANTSEVEYLEGARRKYPTASVWVTVSAVGFSPDGAQALLWATYHRGGEDMSGHFYLLERIGREWVIVEDVEAWIS